MLRCGGKGQKHRRHSRASMRAAVKHTRTHKPQTHVKTNHWGNRKKGDRKLMWKAQHTQRNANDSISHAGRHTPREWRTGKTLENHEKIIKTSIRMYAQQQRLLARPRRHGQASKANIGTKDHNNTRVLTAGNLGIRILLKARVQNSVRDLVTDLVCEERKEPSGWVKPTEVRRSRERSQGKLTRVTLVHTFRSEEENLARRASH